MLTPCSSCDFYDVNSSFCRQLNIVTKAQDCPIHSTKWGVCEKCGRLLLRSQGVVSENGEFRCEACSQSTCRNCVHSNCAFIEDKSLPDYVMQISQQGPVTVQKQVLNPEKLAKHCKNCHCFSDEIGCMKQCGKCNNYQYV